ncbi:MAG: glycosyltransferase family 87 protein [Gemmatimonadales bacterium]|jgi:hypothetical protein
MTRRPLSRRALHLLLAALAVAGVGLWIGFVVSRAGMPELWRRDWYCLYAAGRAFRTGGAGGLYAGQCAAGYFWLYPPYLLYPYALLSHLTPTSTYALVVVEIFAATGMALHFLRRGLQPTSTERFQTLALLVVASAAFNGTVVTGQHSALLTAALAGALWASSRDMPYAAGVFLGVLGLKPNWAIVVIAWLLLTRRWRELGAMAAVGAVMTAATLPMGFDVWREYVAEAPKVIRGFLDTTSGQPLRKLITFEAFSRSTVGRVSPVAAQVVWIGLELLAGFGALVAWTRSRSMADQVAMLVLVLVAANVYVVFYDALALAIPAAVWWIGRDRYPPRLWWAVGGAAGGLWMWQWIHLYVPGAAELPSLSGLFLAVWIGAEALRILIASPGELAVRSIGAGTATAG